MAKSSVTLLPSAVIHSFGNFFSKLATSLRLNSFAADIAVGAVALKVDHLVGDAVQHLFDSGLAGHMGLVDVGLGRAVRGAALQQAQLDAANLRAGLFLDDVGQQRGKAAQLGMAEAVGRGGLGLGDEAAVGIVDALGDGDDAVAVLLVALRRRRRRTCPCRSQLPADR